MRKGKDKNGKTFYREQLQVGMRLNDDGLLVPNVLDIKAWTLKEFEEKKAKKLAEYNAGLHSGNMYFLELSNDFIENFFIHSDLATSTKDIYINAWKKHVLLSSLATMKITDVRISHIQGFYNGLVGSQTAVNNVHKMMRLFYKHLDRVGYAKDITLNLIVPKKEVAKRKIAKEGESLPVYDEEELNAMMEALPSYKNRNMRFITLLALYTGLRISELLGVKYDDISNGNLHVQRQVTPIRVGGEKVLTTGDLKTGSSDRYVPLADSLLPELSAHKRRHQEEQLKNNYRTDFIFTSSSGGLLDRHNMNIALKRFNKSIGVEHKGFHAFRATFGTNLCKNGVPVYEASKLLGHSSIATTEKYYINVDMDGKKKAIESLDFPAI